MTDATMTNSPPDPHAAAQPHNGSIRLVILSIGLLLLLASLDQTIVSTALPTIVSDLGGLEHLSWVVTAYILASTIVAPLYGKLGDLYGRRNMVFVSVGLFLLGSALAGAAQSMGWLIGSRAIQGLGGGGLFVLALSVIGDVIPPKQRGKTQGIFGAVFSVSSVIGPMIGGWFVQAASWHWIFYINIPVGILALIGFGMSFKATGRRVQHRVDWAGAATLSVTLAAITLATALGGSAFDWGSAEFYGLVAIAVVGLVAFVLIESRAAEPIIPLGLFRNSTFLVTSLVGFIAGAAMFGSVTFLPVYLQVAKGMTPTLSGLMLIPMTAGILSTSIGAGQFMGRTGRYKWLPTIGMTALAFGMMLLTTLTRDMPLWQFGAYIALVGFGMGFIFPVVTTAVQNVVPREQLGTATAAGLMFRQVGGSLAVAVFGAIFSARMAAEAAAMGADGSAFQGGGLEISPAALAGLPAAAQEAIGLAVVTAMHPLFWISAGLAVTGFVTSLFLKDVELKSRVVHQSE